MIQYFSQMNVGKYFVNNLGYSCVRVSVRRELLMNQAPEP